MDDIDKLIKKYGHDVLIKQISLRKQHGSFCVANRRGAPRDLLGDLWGLKAVFNHFKALYPAEKNDFVADRVLLFMSGYAKWEKRPDLYAKELADNKVLFEKVRCFASKKLKAKTILNKLAAERRVTKRLAASPSDLQASLVLTPEDFMDGEELWDDPRDYD